MYVKAERGNDALLLTCLGCYDEHTIPDDDPLVASVLAFETAHSGCDPRRGGHALTRANDQTARPSS